MQGLFITTDVHGHQVRPKTKKQVKDLIAVGKTGDIYVEATSFFDNEYDGPLDQVPYENLTVNFVGPNPHADRRFYGTITVKNGKVTIK